MISKFNTIGNLTVFNDFVWDKEVVDTAGNICQFKDINILYGRNYSGKTSLSRILHAIERGELSDKFENPAFSVLFEDGTEVNQNNFIEQGKNIRVFNEDFVRENLRFITDHDDSIEPFAILGDDNNKIEKEIEAIKTELGSNEEGKETGLYALKKAAMQDTAFEGENYGSAQRKLDKQLSDKAIDRAIGIKYKPGRFGDQNYTRPKLDRDIKAVQDPGYKSLTNEQEREYEKLIFERTNPSITPFISVELQLMKFAAESEMLVGRKISESDKIEELVKDAVLNRWVNEGRRLHKEKIENCAFCGNKITEDRWHLLDKHYDEESDKLEKEIDSLVERIQSHKHHISSAFTINKDVFYSIFNQQLNKLETEYKIALGRYNNGLDSLLEQLNSRKDDIINVKEFELPEDCSSEIISIWDLYEDIRNEANEYSGKLSTEQIKARKLLRLKEVSDFVVTIKLSEQLEYIRALAKTRDESAKIRDQIVKNISEKEKLIESKKRELNDEEKGAIKVNEFLNNLFGHSFLTLEAVKQDDKITNTKHIKFEVIRGGKKAYHLSEGECSLLAFCYFLAKLDDVVTRGTKPIIWIDDPISSLDGNHIFFIYSLLNTEVVEKNDFEQLFISTHNLDFLKYLKRLKGSFLNLNSKIQNYDKAYFIVHRQDKQSTINLMPKYLKEYVTEFNFLFHQIYKCASIEKVDDTNFTVFYNFGNNARKFLELYLYYKYPDDSDNNSKLERFFGGDKIPAVLTNRMNNEYSHLCGVFERGATHVEVPEMKMVAKLMLDKLQEDSDQYKALLQSIGVNA